MKKFLIFALASAHLLTVFSCAVQRPFESPASDPFSSQPVETCQDCGYVFNGVASQILDGDTVRLTTTDNKRLTIRLKGIDAPEHSQPYGPEAQAYLTKLTANRTLRVTWSKADRYNRLIGKIEVLELSQEDVCLEMIKAGYAWHYKQFAAEQNADDRIAYENQEKKAREAKRGLWASTKPPTPPWDYRHRRTENIMDNKNNRDNGNGSRHSPTDDELVHRVVQDMQDSAQFAALSDLDLIREIHETPSLADEPAIFELITRLNPAWMNDLSHGNGKPLPTYISVALPLVVAKTQVAYDSCRCNALTVTADLQKPCVYCALRSSIFRNTNDPLYEDDDRHS